MEPRVMGSYKSSTNTIFVKAEFEQELLALWRLPHGVERLLQDSSKGRIMECTVLGDGFSEDSFCLSLIFCYSG